MLVFRTDYRKVLTALNLSASVLTRAVFLDYFVSIKLSILTSDRISRHCRPILKMLDDFSTYLRGIPSNVNRYNSLEKNRYYLQLYYSNFIRLCCDVTYCIHIWCYPKNLVL